MSMCALWTKSFGPFLIYVSYDFDYDINSIPNFKFRTTSNPFRQQETTYLARKIYRTVIWKRLLL